MSIFTNQKASYEPLDGSEEGSDLDPNLKYAAGLWRRRFYILLFSSISTVLFIVGGATYSLKVTATCPSSMPGVVIPNSPAPLQYYNKFLAGDPDTPKFVGQPRAEMDKAWHDLLDGTMIRFSEEELSLAGNSTSIRHKDGGYVGGLGISHSLHCIKRIKQYLHPEYYYSNGEQDWEELYEHVDHCLESLRQEAMCFADVNVFTLKWTAHSSVKPGISVPQPHACVNFEKLHDWMLERAAGLQDLEGPPESLYGWKADEASAGTDS